MMLQHCVHEHSPHTIEGRFQLGSEFRSRQKLIINKLLHLDADRLTDDEQVIKALKCALHNGDPVAAEIFLDHAQVRGIEPYQILTTDHNSAIKYGIIDLIKSKCIDGFAWALQRYPQLGTVSIKDYGGSVLKAAVKFSQPEHIHVLLLAGADRYDVDKRTDSTALEEAIMLQNLDIADVLVEGAEISRLLGTPTWRVI